MAEAAVAVSVMRCIAPGTEKLNHGTICAPPHLPCENMWCADAIWRGDGADFNHVSFACAAWTNACCDVRQHIGNKAR